MSRLSIDVNVIFEPTEGERTLLVNEVYTVVVSHSDPVAAALMAVDELTEIAQRLEVTA